LNIKDWSSAIPGHGGFIDRLSSIAGSTFLLYYFLKLTGI
jgi:CDP-diglyceride synthetase